MYAAAGILLVAPTGRFLLLRRADDGTWALPGGMVEPSDESPAYAALRELGEETGYRGAVNLERATLDATRRADGLVFWTFGGHVPREFPVRLNHEHTDAGWFSAQTLPEATPLHPGLIRLFARLGIR
jgi:8-oxo-dGTP pyrophosphatase MutT (NUDIX family)